MPLSGLLRWLVGTLVVFELVSLTGIARAPHASIAGADPFVGAMLAAVFAAHLAARPKLVEAGAAVLVAAGIAAAWIAEVAWIDLRGAIGIVGASFGAASLMVLAVGALRGRGDERQDIRALLGHVVVLPILALVLRGGADLTAALHPVTRDAIAARLDAAIVGVPLDRLLDRDPALRDLCVAAYHLSPIAIGVALGRARSDRDRLIGATIAAGLASLAIAQAAPIVGPIQTALRSGVTPRFGMPSIHLTLAIVALAAVWRAGSVLRAIAALSLVTATVTALLIGAARLVDLIFAPALAAASLAAAGRRLPQPDPAAIVGPQTIDPRGPLADARGPESNLARAVVPIFFASGFAGLVYEVVFGKQLALAFGSTAQAAATVLATYMGGMALGSWAGGRLGGRADPLRVYALSELGIGVYAALTPLLFALVRAAYVALAMRLGHGWLPVLQFVLGGLAMLPATFLMGVTMPVLIRRLIAEDAALGRAVGLLYGANTFGAAMGALVAGYFMLPAFGVARSTFIAVALNVAAALFGLRLARSFGAAQPGAEAPEGAVAPAPSPEARREGAIALAILFGGGAVTLALEVTYTHLLAVVAGNSVYAFSLMLFAFLVGLGLGAALMRAAMRAFEVGLAVVGAVEVGLAIAILAGVFVWESIPAYFASFGAAGVSLGFGARELARFAVCSVAMIPPAVFIGALYPAAMEIASRAHPRGPALGVGRAAAINTAGNIAGAVLGSFVLLPKLGSLGALHALAALAGSLGLSVLLAPSGRRKVVPIAAALAAILFVRQPARFDLERLASGANVYFAAASRGPVIDHAESVSGGLTTVHEGREDDGSVVHTMLTNGKFQGDDSVRRQVKAQYGFGLCPLLHTERRDRALVIGFGVGGTTRVLRDAGFSRTDVAELSEDVLRLAAKHFRTTNGDVLSHPSVRSRVVDGRNFLLLSRDKYDLINIEISSIWFAGASTLYNREFYALAKARLLRGGVLQQWVQLHHMHREDFVSIVATLRAEMPYVWVYLIGSQGMMIACEDDCTPTAAAVAAIDRAPALRAVIDVFGGTALRLRDDELLSPAGVGRLLQGFAAGRGHTVESFVSTDDDMRLEYRTPRGNVLPDTGSLMDNLRMLREARGRD